MTAFWTKAKQISVPRIGKVSYQKIADASASELNISLSEPTINAAGEAISPYQYFNEGNAAPPFEASMGAKNDINIYRVTYKTRSPDTQKTYQVSGLLSVPISDPEKPGKSSNPPLVSYQHGTILYPEDAPSNLFKDDAIQRDPLTGAPYSLETLINLVKLGGNGFAVAASDYIGNNASQATQSLGVKATTIQTSQDMIQASKAVLRALGHPTKDIFLNGWSMGALHTQWLANALEKQGRPAKGIAATSGPSDLLGIMRYWMNDYPGTPSWFTSAMPIMLGAYEKYYEINGLMRDGIRPKYLKTAKQLYNKTYDWSKGAPDLPALPKQMFTDKIIGMINRGDGAFADKLINNSTLQGKYSTPSAFFGGENDTVAPTLYAINIPVNYQGSIGSSISRGESMGQDATHRSAFLSSMFNTEKGNILDFFTSALA